MNMQFYSIHLDILLCDIICVFTIYSLITLLDFFFFFGFRF